MISLCRLTGRHKNQTISVGTAEAGANITRCIRCREVVSTESWGEPEMREWPKFILSKAQMRELVKESFND